MILSVIIKDSGSATRMWRLYVVIVLAVYCCEATAFSPCMRLTKCAVKKCFVAEKLSRAIYNQSTDGMFATLVDQFNFLCIAAKCRPECRACDQCQYALDQIKHLASGSQTEMECPKMESCSLQCLKRDVSRMVSCVQHQCNVFCFDGDCPHCKSVAKRIFLDICRKHNIPDLPNIKYSGSCMNLFEEAAVGYVRERRLRNQ